jgi:hypothetical protein
VWVDDVTLEVVGKETPTTGRFGAGPDLPADEQQRLHPLYRAAPEQPMNPDFEQ